MLAGKPDHRRERATHRIRVWKSRVPIFGHRAFDDLRELERKIRSKLAKRWRRFFDDRKEQRGNARRFCA